ncbi:hypothetical protein DL769_009460 [Monosporascus sp. CRB-8-3]|nr:hypothetical protein DL769_009460 [Monosporascus sp. CRB-8-3]
MAIPHPHSAHPPLPVHPPFHPHAQQQHHHHEGSHPFHNLLHDDPHVMGPHEAPPHQPEPPDQDAVDRDMDMLIEHGDDSEMEVDVSQPLEDRTKRDGGPGNKT